MSDILSALKFCAGSIAKKDFVPALKHFVIEHGLVRGYNGVLALCSPIPFDIACKPHAETLIKAIANCSTTVQLSITPAGRLSVKSGTFKVFVDCIQEDTPHATPDGVHVQLDGTALLAGLKAVAPFMSDDAARKWSNGVLIANSCLQVTNNIIAIQRWVGFDFGAPITIPKEAIKEMLRIGDPPTHAQLSEGSITFHYDGNRWLRTQLYDSSQWPDFSKFLDNPDALVQPVDEEMFVAAEALRPFVEKSGAVYFNMQQIATSPAENGGEGATYDVPSLMSEGAYHVDHLLSLKSVATHIDWSLYPKPCVFQGEMLRGAIVGRKR
jgi:hypothetical protein